MWIDILAPKTVVDALPVVGMLAGMIIDTDTVSKDSMTVAVPATQATDTQTRREPPSPGGTETRREESDVHSVLRAALFPERAIGE